MVDIPGMLPYSVQLPPGQSAASLFLEKLGLSGIGGPTSQLGQLLAPAPAPPPPAEWLQAALAQQEPPAAMQVGPMPGADPSLQGAQQPTGVTPGAMPELFGQMAPTEGGPVPTTPDAAAAQPQMPADPAREQTKSQWGAILSDPATQAALFQFGLSLTQPSWDSGSTSSVFRALGEGAEAGGRAYEGQLEEAETRQKEADRQTQLGIQQERNQLSQQNMRLDYDAALRGQNVSAGTAAEGRKNAIITANISQQGMNQRALAKSVQDTINDREEAVKLEGGEPLTAQEKAAITQDVIKTFTSITGQGAPATPGVGQAAATATPTTQAPIRYERRPDGSIGPTQ